MTEAKLGRSRCVRASSRRSCVHTGMAYRPRAPQVTPLRLGERSAHPKSGIGGRLGDKCRPRGAGATFDAAYSSSSSTGGGIVVMSMLGVVGVSERVGAGR